MINFTSIILTTSVNYISALSVNWLSIDYTINFLVSPQSTEEISEFVKSELLILEPEKLALYSFVLRKEVPKREVISNATF